MKLYILKCKNNKYYIGTTTLNTTERLTQHISGRGSTWTKKYPPLWIEKEIKNCDKYDEDKWTKIYMDKYGIQNVRGGSYSKMDLDFETINLLEREVNHANQKCLFCGKSGHFINQCPSKKKPFDKKNKYHSKNLYYLNMSCDYESEEGSDSESDSESDSYGGCWACSYCNKEFDTKKGAQFHENVHCKVKKQRDKSDSDEEIDIRAGCYRCGRKGHYASKCYAKKHIKGYYL